MKKWIFGLIAQLAMLPAAYGLVSGNPADPMLGNESLWLCDSPWWNPKLGYQRDYVSDRKLKSNDLPTQRIDEFSLTSDQAIIAFDFCQRIEIYGTVGASSCFVTDRPNNTGFATFETHVDSQFKDGTIWSVGGKVIILDWCNALLAIDGKYSEYFSNATWDDVHTGALATKAKIEYKEWQASLGVAYNYCCVVPYISLNFSGLTNSRIYDLQVNPATTTTLNSYRLTARNLVGLSIGTSFIPVSSFYVTVEAQIINERALTLQGQIRF